MSYSWQGASGRWYEFNVARARQVWAPEGGLYMFVKPAPDSPNLEYGGPVVLYLARTHDFSAALARHAMWAAARELGANEIHLLAVNDERLRAHFEQDLLAGQTPILNRQMLPRVA